MNDIAELTLKIDSTDAVTANAILSKLTETSKGTETSAELMMTAFKKLMVVLGPTALAGVFASQLKSVIELEESWVRLGEKAGTTAAQMSGVDLPARLAGTSLDAVAQSIARISRAVGEAQLGDVQKKGLFKALGIDPNDGTDPAERMYQVAKSLMSMKDANVQAYVSQQFLNRGFAEMRPFLKELVEQGGIHARVTNEQAAAAKRFEDEIIKVSAAMQDGKIAIANDYLPWLTDIVKGFAEGYKQGGLFEAAIRGVQTALTGSELYKVSRDIDATTSKLLQLQNQLSAANFYRNNPDAARRDPSAAANARGDTSSARLEQLVQEAQTKLLALQKYKADLEALAAGPAKHEGASSGTTDGESESEKAIRELMEKQRNYEKNIAAAKGYYELFSDTVRTGQALIAEERKQELMSESDAVKKMNDLEDQRLQELVRSQDKQRKLHEEHGDLGKAEEATQAIIAANAARVNNEEVTTARIKTIQDTSTLDRQRDLAQRGADQTVSFQDDLTKLEAWLTEQNNLNQLLLNEKLRDEEEYGSRSAEIAARYEEEKSRIYDDQAKKRYGINQVYHKLDLDSAGFFFGSMKALMQVKSKEMFEIGKLGAIGETIVNTYKSATGAYAALSSIPYVGPALGAAAAAAAVLAGLANVAVIKSTQYGSGAGGGAVPTFNANPVTGNPQTPFISQGPSAGEAPTLQVIIQGHVLGTQDFVDGILIPSLKDAINNRDFTIIDSNSRQAQNLAALAAG